MPSDGGVRALRALLDRLDDAAIEVDELSVHTPDLDDVFFALTGRPARCDEGSLPMSSLSYAVTRLGNDAAAQPAARAALPRR